MQSAPSATAGARFLDILPTPPPSDPSRFRACLGRTHADRERELRSVRYLADLQERGRRLREEREAAERAAGTFVPQSPDGSDAEDAAGHESDSSGEMPALAPAVDDDSAGAEDADEAHAAPSGAGIGIGVGNGAPRPPVFLTETSGAAADSELDLGFRQDVPPLEAVSAEEMVRVIQAKQASKDGDITGPRASAMSLFADADADEVVEAPQPVAKTSVDTEALETIRPTRLAITNLEDEEGDGEDPIPEEIVSSARPQWFSVGAGPWLAVGVNFCSSSHSAAVGNVYRFFRR
jgi:hypothetical protein